MYKPGTIAGQLVPLFLVLRFQLVRRRLGNRGGRAGRALVVAHSSRLGRFCHVAIGDQAGNFRGRTTGHMSMCI